MITPFFNINQDEEFIFIEVKISHVRFSAQNIEMVVQNELFVFSMTPYYLRLRLPFSCVDDERAHAEFDSKSESVKIKIPKEIKGQDFPDLDLTGKLLARVDEKKVEKGPLIEELDVDNVMSTGDVNNSPGVTEGEKFDWEITQQEAQDPEIQVTSIKYGFNNQYDQIINISSSNGNDINELGDSENTSATDRILERLIKENVKFDLEYYAADYIMEKYPSEDDDKMFKELITWSNPVSKKFLKWYQAQQKLPQEEREKIMGVDFTKEEQEKMIALPRKSYLIEDSYRPQLLTLLISLLFAYHFELRETEGDHNTESAWTIGKLTPQICFLDSQILVPSVSDDNILRATVITSIRRALSYPLHRNFNLISKVWEDVYYNLRGGKRLVLKSLLDIKELFRFHDVYYVYDKIWMEDLCAWLISDDLSEGMIRTLAHDLKNEYLTVSKTDITFEKLEEGTEDEFVAINLQEIEEMAEELFRAYQNN